MCLYSYLSEQHDGVPFRREYEFGETSQAFGVRVFFCVCFVLYTHKDAESRAHAYNIGARECLCV